MTSTTKLLTKKFSSYLARELRQEITESTNTAFYIYAGVHGDVIGDIPVPTNANRDLVVDAYHNMIFGKRVTASDIALLVRNVPYAAGTVYAQYDDTDDDLYSKDFYCYVDEGSLFHMYKCLDNNFGANSTIEPSFAFVTDESNYIFQTSDGYVWKYMYSVSSNQKKTFATDYYFPITFNTDVQDATYAGAIDIIHIEQNDLDIPGGGKKYDNYVSGVFSGNQIRVTGNNYLYAISNATIDYTAGFYTGCMLYLSGGIGAGQYAKIVDYFTNENGNFIVIDRAFDISPTNGTTFEINPDVKIVGSGAETVNAIARALVNATGSNSIYKIEMLDKGANYDYATASVIANSVITQDANFVPAELRPIYSPVGGHGAAPEVELGCDAVNIVTKFSDDESGTLLASNRFQQIGLIRDPKFANVNIEYASHIGTFTTGETIYKIEPVRINANIAMTNTSAVITGESSVLASATIVSSGDSGQYIPGDILTIEGGTYINPAQVRVLSTKVLEVTINNHGTGYTACTTFNANLALGTATTNATFSVTTNATGECNSIVIVDAGSYTTNPPYLANSTPTEGDVGTGLTLNLRMGVNVIEIYDTGSYALIPTDLATNKPLSNVGTGVDAELLLDFDPTLTAYFTNQLEEGDYIYLTTSDASQQQLAVVNSITNSSSLTITVNGFFTCAASKMYLPRMSTTATVKHVANATNLLLANVSGELFTSDIFIGETTSAKAVVGTIYRNDVAKNLSSFIQLYKYDVSVWSGSFIENEIIYQGNSLANATATALIHSVLEGEATILYTSNQVGQFTNTSYVQGVNSLAVASINKSYSPELEFGSGRVLYIENVEPVTRAIDKTETIQLVLTF